VAALGLAFCSTDGGPTDDIADQVGPEYGVSHDDIIGNIGDVFKDGRQVPPAEGQKLHSCGKLRYATFGRVLTSRGITIPNATANTTGQLYAKALNSWGVANFPGRIPESTRNTTSGLVNLQDITLAMAEEMVTAANPDGAYAAAAMDCGGATTKLFNGTACDRDGFACLLGATPNQKQMDLCNNMVTDTVAGVTDIVTRKRLTVAALAGTVDMCD
jgi:hypothetical protein